MELKMKLMLLITLFGISFRVNCDEDDDYDMELVGKCFEAYSRTLLTEKTFEGHCSRIQAMVDCLSEEPDKNGEELTKFRYFTTQEAMLDTKLGLCPSLKFTKLKDIVKNTDLARKHRFIDDIGKDHFEPCAAQIQKAALQHFFSSLDNHDECRDIEDYAEYFKTKAKQEGCKAKILEYFLSVVSDLGVGVVKTIRKHMGYKCMLDRDTNSRKD